MMTNTMRRLSDKRMVILRPFDTLVRERTGDHILNLSACVDDTHMQKYRTSKVTLGEAVEKYTANPPKGEFVLIVAGAPAVEKEVASETDAAARVQQLMAEGLSRKDAVKQTAKELDLPKNVVYDIALKDSE